MWFAGSSRSSAHQKIAASLPEVRVLKGGGDGPVQSEGDVGGHHKP
jgi:hypothetical protein